MRLCKNNYKGKFLLITPVKWEEKVNNVTNMKYDRHGRSPTSRGILTTTIVTGNQQLYPLQVEEIA